MASPLAFSAVAGLLFLYTGWCGDQPRFNEVQVIGTHNSYHIAPQDSLLGVIKTRNSDAAKSLQYTHRPLNEQFSALGIRQIELDVWADPNGGHFAEPRGNKIAAAQGLSPGPNHDPAGV